MMREGIAQEIAWGQYVIGNNIPGLNTQMVEDYIRYLGNLRWESLGLARCLKATTKSRKTWNGYRSMPMPTTSKRISLKLAAQPMPRARC